MTRRKIDAKPTTAERSAVEKIVQGANVVVRVYPIAQVWLLDDQLVEDCQKRPTDYLLDALKRARASGLPLVSMTTGKRLETAVDTVLGDE